MSARRNLPKRIIVEKLSPLPSHYLQNGCEPFKMTANLLVMRDGRKLEVTEYGDRAGHPTIFFHGLIGSHHQASYISEEAGRIGIRIIAPNRPGVGRSEFIERKSALEAVADVEDVARALQLDEFSLIGISGGTPYALAALSRMADRVKTVTVISGMGPMRLSGALRGMDRRRRIALDGRIAISGRREARVSQSAETVRGRSGAIARSFDHNLVVARSDRLQAKRRL